MFYHDETIFHMIDRCTRWHAGCILKADKDGKKKTTQNLLEALYLVWLSVHGPMETLYVDGESGLNANACTNLHEERGH